MDPKAVRPVRCCHVRAVVPADRDAVAVAGDVDGPSSVPQSEV